MIGSDTFLMHKPFMDNDEIEAINLCLSIFTEPIKSLEWGSGNSTTYFFSQLPHGSQWFSYEHNTDWYKEVENRLKSGQALGVTLALVPPNLPFDNVTDGDFDTFKQYVLAPINRGVKFEFILVDGRARVECMAVGWEMLHEHGVMILHDAQRREYDKGIPGDCYWVRITNPRVLNEGPISALFMARNKGVAIELQQALVSKLSQDIIIQSNLQIYDAYLSYSATEEQKDNSLLGSEVKNAASQRSCLFLNTYYKSFVDQLYQRNISLSEEPYFVQHQANQETLFGDSDFYSQGLKALGWQVEDLIVNIPALQVAWARENNFEGSGLIIAVEQIRRVLPAVVYLQDLSFASQGFLAAIRPFVKLIVGQIASPVPAQADLAGFDLIFSSFPHFVDRFRTQGITAYYQPLAFDPRVLQTIGSISYQERPINCSFVGGISGLHAAGTTLLEVLVAKTPIQLWGYGAASLPADSSLLGCHNGEVWGKDMFALLASSKITINRHIDVAENNANNMRLFEATGCGALLITDYKNNLDDLFVIGTEIVAYRSAEECAALINYYLVHSDEAEIIARAGQKRTLRDHTYSLRMEQTSEILARHIHYRFDNLLLHMPNRISDGHQVISQGEVTSEMESAWKNSAIPLRQRALVQQQLMDMYHGIIATPFQVLADIMRPIVAQGTSVLEIGCASGYYYEILPYLLNKRLNYCGIDYSKAMIDMGKDYYPEARFLVADGASLPFTDISYDVVISSGVLLHVPNYVEHIKETVRVANKYIVVARTPICKNNFTRYIKKYAYEVETVELRFNETELLGLFQELGFDLKNKTEYVVNISSDEYETTYLLKRRSVFLNILGGSTGSRKKKDVEPPSKKMNNGPVVLVSRAIAFTFPLAYAYLAGYLRSQGEEVVMLFKDMPAEILVRRIMELNPLIVGFGNLYPELKEIKELIGLLDRAGRTFPIVIGGQMVSPIPEFALKITGADYGVIGEGEIVLYQLVSKLREGNDPSNLKGLVVRKGDIVISNGPGDYIKDLAQLPPVPYDLFPTDQWLPIGVWYAANCPQPHWKIDDKVINVHGGRGCPFTCNFCYHHSKPRYRDIALMMEEAQEALIRFDGNMLYFSDDLVLAEPKRARQLIDAVGKLDRPISYSVSTRFDVLSRMDDSLLQDLKKSGCRNMGIGLESGSDRILKVIGKNCTVQLIEEGLERLRVVGIYPSTAIMVGQYTETIDDVKASLSLMQRTAQNNPYLNYAFTLVTPFPGSKLHKLIFEKGYVKDDQEFYDRYFSTQGEWTQVVNLSAMSDGEVYDAYREMSISYGEIKRKHSI